MTQIPGNLLSEAPPVPGAPPSHDWEEIFESSEYGFIALVKQAKTVDGLRDCTHLIIRNLFTRDDDLPIRDVYEHALDGMLPKTGTEIPPMDKGVNQIVQLLREIKEYRQAKALEHLQEKAIGSPEQSDPERREEIEPSPLPGMELTEDHPKPFEGDEEEKVANLLADLISERINKRFNVLTGRIETSGKLPPFILSKEFARHFEKLLREYFIPCFMDNSRALIARTLQQPEELRREYLVNMFADRVSSQNLWDRWKDVWIQLIHSQELPKKPEQEKKTGLLGGLKKKKKKVPAFMKEMTLDEWKKRTTAIKENNIKAEQLWAQIATQSRNYQAPDFEDEKLLMDLFARSASGMQSHIDAMRQIAHQGSDIGRSLSAYAQGKDLDLATLAVCHQYPDIFLGKKKGLSKMLMGKEDNEIAMSFPMVKRYLL